MLKQILAQMVYNVEISNAPQYRILKNGLRITIKPEGGKYFLTLSRKGVYPSYSEWETVILHFPYTLQEIKPSEINNGTIYALVAYIPKEKGV